MELKTYFTVTAVVQNPKGEVLILKKSPDDYNYPNKWSFCSGYAKEFQSAEDEALREVKEETGLKGKIAKKGKLIEVNDKKLGRHWVIAPFLCKVKSSKIRLDHENNEFRWIKHKDIKKYDTVPGLEKDLKVLGLR